jgi:transcriptional regulator with XRE-family HTH domain
MSDTFKNRLVQAMQHRGIKAAELAKRTGLSKAQISQYTNGVYEAKQTALYKLAVALDVSEAWLMGYDVDMERLISQKCAEQTNIIELMQLHFGSEVTDLVQMFSQLNRKGKKKALDSIQDLNKITEYIEKESD